MHIRDVLTKFLLAIHFPFKFSSNENIHLYYIEYGTILQLTEMQINFKIKQFALLIDCEVCKLKWSL